MMWVYRLAVQNDMIYYPSTDHIQEISPATRHPILLLLVLRAHYSQILHRLFHDHLIGLVSYSSMAFPYTTRYYVFRNVRETTSLNRLGVKHRSVYHRIAVRNWNGSKWFHLSGAFLHWYHGIVGCRTKSVKQDRLTQVKRDYNANWRWDFSRPGEEIFLLGALSLSCVFGWILLNDFCGRVNFFRKYSFL